jgi:hypothetical protein
VPNSCPSPDAPGDGSFTSDPVGITDFTVGRKVRFQCKAGFMLDGAMSATCTASGAWSEAVPRCVRACTYPGSVIGGRIVDGDIRFFYRVGDRVAFACEAANAKMVGASMMECLANGRWSSAVPTCEEK